jgi:ribonuclease P protein component
MARREAELAKSAKSPVLTLKRRAEFQRTRKGARWATPGFVLEANRRGEADSTTATGQARFGFTVTRQIGIAVERNRIRRRLKAAVRDVQMQHAKAEFDYVLIARRPALTSSFDALIADLMAALGRVHSAPARGQRPRARK